VAPSGDSSAEILCRGAGDHNKCQMYGRAGFELLKPRVFPSSLSQRSEEHTEVRKSHKMLDGAARKAYEILSFFPSATVGRSAYKWSLRHAHGLGQRSRGIPACLSPLGLRWGVSPAWALSFSNSTANTAANSRTCLFH
jgi:hypothetical protein